MSDDLWVFGYGSLVNAETHGYAECRPARLKGWRRHWRHWINGPTRFVTSLTAEPDEHVDIDGLIARVPAPEWHALDQRERGYRRVDIPADQIAHSVPGSPRIITYQSETSRPGDAELPILQSYLDCVLQGFSRIYGADGIAHFLDTTEGWHVPIKRDRGAPIYPRAITVTDQEATEFDRVLAAHGAVWLEETDPR